MQPSESVLFRAVRHLLVGAVTLAVCGLVLPTGVAAQVAPPIDRVTGTVVPSSTLVQEQMAAGTVIVNTLDGVEQVWHFTKEILGHGGKGRGVDPLQGLRDGTTVVVHDPVAGSDGPVVEFDQIGDEEVSVTEGTVIRVDHGRQQIIIRFDDGRDERLHVTDRVAMESAAKIVHASTGTPKVTVYYADEAGQRVAHFFEKE